MSLPVSPDGQWFDLKQGAIISMETITMWIQQVADMNMQRLLQSMFKQPPARGAQFYNDPTSANGVFPLSYYNSGYDNRTITVGAGSGLTSGFKYIRLSIPMSMSTGQSGTGLSALFQWCEANLVSGTQNIGIYIQLVRDYAGTAENGLQTAFKNGLPIGSAPDATFLINDQIGADPAHISSDFYFDSTSCYWYGKQTAGLGLSEYNPLGDKSKALFLLYPSTTYPSNPAAEDADLGSRNIIRIGGIYFDGTSWMVQFPDAAVAGVLSTIA